jgi:hypothetical protein
VPDESLGVVVHPGELVVRGEVVAVALRRVVAHGSWWDVYAAAVRRPDPRSALERQADIRARRGGVQPAPRRLLPAVDGGTDLRLGQLTGPDRATWAYPKQWSDGQLYEAVYEVPAGADLVLAWPELGVPETVVPIDVPDSPVPVPVWDAPSAARPAPPGLRAAQPPTVDWEQVAAEVGRVVAGPSVLHRGERAVVVVEHVTATRHGLRLGLSARARGGAAQRAYEPPTVALVRGEETAALDPVEYAGYGAEHHEGEYVLPLPAGGPLDLLVSWPAAGLDAALATVPLPADLAGFAARSEAYWPTG